ncbi:related to MutS protein homolog 5 [Ustilago trichophora]|uniref:Related to MutS protein homolog 5 n=1 Tax=Ustilago trichophora TaxID=86804 RepID=A0A5C3DSH9_9BASI|nr:related to MutS protein homolog 5 [Ustilago trichophora]
MSATTPSLALGSASGRTPAASLPADGDNRASIDQSAVPISALAIEALHGRFGCAVYVEEEHQLLLCEDLPGDFAVHDNGQLASARTTGNASDQHDDDDGSAAATSTIAAFGHASYGFVESLLSQFHPDVIVVSARCPESILVMLQKFAEQRSGTLELRPARDFQTALGLSSIEEATTFGSASAAFRGTFECGPSEEGSMTRLVLLDARVATSKCSLSVAAAAPLLSSLRSRRDIGRSLTLVSLCLDDYLYLDENTLKSLSICSSDVHGFVHAKAGREGFSILVSQPMLRRWIMMPLAKRGEIERRHEAVELLVRQESASEVIQIRSKLAELGGLPSLCYALNRGVGSAKTWDKLLKTCLAVISIRSELNMIDLTRSEMLRETGRFLELVSDLESVDIYDLLHHLRSCSKNEGKITVRAGVDMHLDELRKQYSELPALLDGVATELRREAAFRSTTTQIGYLISVPGGEIVDMLADTSLEQQFASDVAVYLKNSRMTTMDQHLGDLASFIIDREIEILDGLQTILGECSPVLLTAHGALSQLDCLIAFARAATLYDLRRPILVDEQVLRLKGSRHALKALTDESFVPNDIDLRGGVGLRSEEGETGSDTGPDESGATMLEQDMDASPSQQQQSAAAAQEIGGRFSVMVLTGANSSGKSCLLQQAALAVFLSQCGSFVPAAHAELGVFDKILTRMRQDESVTSEGSSFTRELGRLYRAMAMSTPRSLVILDEVGRECRSDDGAGLFIATIFEFLQRGPQCPIVVSATHHLRAIERHLSNELPIQRAHMQTILLPTLADSYNSLIYLYRLKPGFAGTSHACHCARLCGVPESVVERADRICRVGSRAWHDGEAMRDEEVVRRLLQLELGSGGEEEGREKWSEERQGAMADEEAVKLIKWVLEGGDEESVDGMLREEESC